MKPFPMKMLAPLLLAVIAAVVLGCSTTRETQAVYAHEPPRALVWPRLADAPQLPNEKIFSNSNQDAPARWLRPVSCSGLVNNNRNTRRKV